MRIYAITLLSVVVLCYLAEQYDDPVIDSIDSTRIKHSGNALFFFVLASCVLILVSGLRYRVGADYLSYYYGYEGYIKDLTKDIKSLDEPGFGLISWIATRFYKDASSPIFMASMITVGLYLTVIYRHTDKLLLATVLFVIMGCWHGSFNGIRQYLASAILFCGYKSLKERHIIKYLIIVFVATMFHRSAIVMAFLYGVVYRKINFTNLLITIILAGIILTSFERVLSIVNVIMDKTYNPHGGYTSHDVNILRVIATCVPAIVFLIAFSGREMNKSETFFVNITIIHAASSIYTMNSALLYRVGVYTAPFMLLAIPELIKEISERNRKIITAGFIIMFGIMWWYELSIGTELRNYYWIFNR